MKLSDVAGVKIYAHHTSAGETFTREAIEHGKRLLLAEAFGPESGVELVHTATGAPRLTGAASHLAVSVSHSHRLLLMAIGSDDAPLGIDTETFDRIGQLRRVAAKFLAPGDEMERWGSGDTLPVRAWTIKEALYKAAATEGWALCDIPLPVSTMLPATVETPAGRFLLVDVGLEPAWGCATLAVRLA